jgi:glutamyl-tRNA synthetase
MVEENVAYECYCTEAEVRERNEQAMTEGRPPGYDGKCRALTPDELSAP